MRSNRDLTTQDWLEDDASLDSDMYSSSSSSDSDNFFYGQDDEFLADDAYTSSEDFLFGASSGTASTLSMSDSSNSGHQNSLFISMKTFHRANYRAEGRLNPNNPLFADSSREQQRQLDFLDQQSTINWLNAFEQASRTFSPQTTNCELENLFASLADFTKKLNFHFGIQAPTTSPVKPISQQTRTPPHFRNMSNALVNDKLKYFTFNVNGRNYGILSDACRALRFHLNRLSEKGYINYMQEHGLKDLSNDHLVSIRNEFSIVQQVMLLKLCRKYSTAPQERVMKLLSTAGKYNNDIYKAYTRLEALFNKKYLTNKAIRAYDQPTGDLRDMAQKQELAEPSPSSRQPSVDIAPERKRLLEQLMAESQQEKAEQAPPRAASSRFTDKVRRNLFDELPDIPEESSKELSSAASSSSDNSPANKPF